MDDVEQLRELIDQRMTQSDALARLQFSELNRRVDGLTEQVRETNGRVRTHDALLSAHTPEIATLNREMGEVKKARRTLMDDLKANAILIVGLVVTTVSATVGVLAFFGKLQ